MAPLINISVTHQVLFFLTASGDIFVALSTMYYIIKNSDIISSQSVHVSALLCLNEVLYAMPNLIGNASRLLLRRILQTAPREIPTTMNSPSTLERECVVISVHLAEMNASVSLPLIAHHADYFLWSIAGFVGDLPILECGIVRARYFLLEVLMSSIPLLYVQYYGALVGDELRNLRRRVRGYFVEKGLQEFRAKTWGPGLILALSGNELGITFDGICELNRQNVTNFFAFCLSTGFIFFQITIASARGNFDLYCSSLL